MSSYILVNEESKKLDYYNGVSLMTKYLKEDYFDMSDIKEVDDIDFLINDLRYRGVLLFNVSKINSVKAYKVKTKIGVSYLEFDSVLAAVNYCKEAKLSSAGDSYIKNTIMKNLNGKTKSAYGLSWTLELRDIDISNYKINIKF